MTLGQNRVLRNGHFSDFWSYFEDRMANLGLIDFKLCLYIKINVNAGQKNRCSYLKTFGQNGHQLAQNRPDTTFGHNSVIFHPILTFLF